MIHTQQAKERTMNILEYIRQLLKVRQNISDQELEQQIQAIAESLGLNLEQINEQYALLIAEEIDKTSSSISAVETGISLIEEPSQPKPVVASKKRKNPSPVQANEQNPVETLKPAVQNLKQVVSNEAEAMLEVFNIKSQQVEDSFTAKIVNRCKQINPNILKNVATSLTQEEYTERSLHFRGEIEQIFDIAFADILNIEA
jgi:hypothetical protein